VLRFFRSKAATPRQLAVLQSSAESVQADSAPAAEPVLDCLLAACTVGARATVLEMRCDDIQACRRHAMVLDVRGTRIALGKALTAGITVRPLPA